jgi:endonuclease/exonuclease/phosphatase family metal-dependent hydrolase
MKKELKKLNTGFYLALGSLLLLAPIALAQLANEQAEANIALSLMSYNIKFASPTFEPSWEVRREMQVDLIRKYKPDIIGTQEGLKDQVDYLQDQLNEYVVVGEGRKGGDDDEHMAIFFKRDKYRLREMGSFQLSKTPEVIGSGPPVNPRMVTWVRLAVINRPQKGEKHAYPQDYRGHWENTQEFYVFNTHFFNGRKDSLARFNASKLILERIKELDRFGAWISERAVFLMGDFNCRPGSPPYKVLVGDDNSNEPGLLHDTVEDGSDIDWILYKGPVKKLSYEEVDYNVKGVYPSDHKPIFVEVNISR